MNEQSKKVKSCRTTYYHSLKNIWSGTSFQFCPTLHKAQVTKTEKKTKKSQKVIMAKVYKLQCQNKKM